MAQAIRERTNELGVLKTLGFSDGRDPALVLVESCLIAVVGGGLGLRAGLADRRVRRRSRPAACCRRSISPARDVVLGAR